MSARKYIGRALSTLFLSLIVSLISPAQAVTPTEVQELVANDGSANDFFGLSVAIDGDTILVGARRDDDNGIDSGSAYVFTRVDGTWIQQAKLLPGDGATGDRLDTVAVSGDTAVVGASSDGDNGSNSGSAYVFVKTAGVWTEQAKLLPSDGAAGDLFGSLFGVTIDGDTIIIGARGDDDNGSGSGSAYVFVRAGGIWTEQAKLLPSDGAAGDQFGYRLSLDQDTVVVGAGGDDDNGSSSGSAYVFVRTGGLWSEQAKLLPSDGAASDFFGNTSVDVDGDTVIVGAFNDDHSGFTSGSAYVFVRTAGVWSEQAKLVASDAAFQDQFGDAVRISGDIAVVSADLDDDKGFDSGSAYIFARSSGVWTQIAKLTASDGGVDGSFGVDVAIDGATAIVGSFLHEHAGVAGGAAYVFLLPSDATPTGMDVTVLPVPVDELGDPIADAPAVTFEFDSVIGSGETTVTIAENGPPPPSGFKLIGLTGGTTYFDLQTTAVYNGFVEICINYSDLTVAGDPANLNFAHNEGGIWVDITSSNDTTNRIICGMTSFFSLFAIVEVADPITLLTELVDAVAALNARNGIINSLDAKLDVAERALTDAIENNDFAAMNVLMSAFINATEAQRGEEITDAEADDLVDRAQEITLVLQGVTL